MSSIRELVRLQEVDSELATRRAALEEIDRQLADVDALEELRRRLGQERETLAALQSEQRSAEMDLEETRGKVQEEEGKLYGGSVRNPKDLVSLQQEVMNLRTQLQQREDVQLQMMSRLEAQSAATRELEAQLARMESERTELETELSARREQIENQMQALTQQRQRIAALVPSKDLALYDHLLVTKQGRAIGRVERAICQGCRVNLPMAIQQRVRADRMLVQCPSCGRILYLG